MVKKMVGLYPGKSGQLSSSSPELHKVSDAMTRDVAESEGSARPIIKQRNQQKFAIVTKPTEQSI